jgi:hypothetical protein
LWLARKKPTVVKQTKASIAQSAVFGKACHISAMFRMLLKPVLPDAGDKKMMRSFERAMRQWLYGNPLDTNQKTSNLPFLTGYQFNEVTGVSERLKKQLEVTRNPAGGLIINVPELVPAVNIIAKAGTKSIKLTLTAATLHIDNDTAMANYTTELNIPYNKTTIPAQQLDLPVNPAPGNLTLVAVSIEYNTNSASPTNFINDKSWTPAGIVGSFYN